MNIYLDVDDVVLAWHEAYIERYNIPMPTDWVPYEDIRDQLAELKRDKTFWLNLKAKHMPDFQPAGYVSARSVPVQWTKDVMKLRKIPGRTKVTHVGWGESKMEVLKRLKCDLFIDDRYDTFLECQKHGIPCLLMDSPQNRHHQTDLRIHDLKIKSILDKFDKLWPQKKF